MGGLIRMLLVMSFMTTLLACAVLAGVLYYGKLQYEAAGPDARGGAEETVFVLERGTGVTRIAQQLFQDGLISDPMIFTFAVRFLGKGSDLKAGEYSVPSGSSMAEIVEILRSGKSVLHRITVPEGYSSVQVVDLLNEATVLSGTIRSIPREGTLLPETYLVQRGTERQTVIERMTAAHDKVLKELWAERAPDLPLSTPEEAVVLASIVEKETGIAGERPMVAAVFVNRLNKGMLLQADPTVIYPITQGRPLGRRIRESELNDPNPFNTYVHRGLPPSPIANPGRDAIAAVLNPPETDYLYFVADGSGGHAFAKTLAEHNRNVAAWRRYRRETGK